MESPFQSLLHTNTVPSDVDCDKIRKLVVGPRMQVVDLTHEIEETKRRLEELTRKRDELTEYIDAHLALVSPVRRLPEDVVRAIFMACMPSARNAVMSPTDSPLLLSRICSAWRQLALSTPQLWASLHIVVLMPPKLEELTQNVTAWLSRSGIVPLSISLVLSQPYTFAGLPDDEIQRLLSSLAALSRRWKKIRMVVPSFLSFEPLAHLSSEDFPLLQTVSVGTTYDFVDDLSGAASPWRSLPFLTAPALRSVSISSGYRFAELQVSRGQLIHLCLGGTQSYGPRFCFVQDVIPILHQCLRLETCKLSLGTANTIFGGAFTPVSLPHLWHLNLIDNMTDFEADQLFQNLTLPTLRSLKYASAWRFRSLRPLFLPSLEWVSLSVHMLPTTDLIDALRLSPLLHYLELTGEPVLAALDIGPPPADADFLARLIPNSDPGLCPNLRQIKLSHFHALTDDTLLAFIRARTGPDGGAVARLVSVTVTLHRQRTLDIAAELHEAVADGLQLSLEYSPYPDTSKSSPWEFAEEEDPDFIR
ncbi:hypothetical protein B0H13DRAFT_877524 [Mycena leptocephala]|nr:hypothetical protein B0H13DRAFT_877524 [Mycena leptocephala]